MKLVLRLGLAALVYAIDFGSKVYTNAFIQPLHYGPAGYPFGGIPVFQNFLGIDFCINHAVNHGAAWSILSSVPFTLLMLRICIMAGLLSYMCFAKQAKPYLSPLTLIATGALGNITDYFIYGHVVDMFHVILWGYDFPVFNMADSAVFCGVLWLALLSKKRQPNLQTPQPQ